MIKCLCLLKVNTIVLKLQYHKNISHKEFIAILNEKDKYEKMKYNLISENGDEKQKKHKIIIKK